MKHFQNDTTQEHPKIWEYNIVEDATLTCAHAITKLRKVISPCNAQGDYMLEYTKLNIGQLSSIAKISLLQWCMVQH